MYIVKEVVDRGKDELKQLFLNAGWTKYTENVDRVLKGIYSSLITLAAWDGNNLIGFVRAVGVGETIVFIQDLVVLDTYKRKGIGKKLIDSVLERFVDVRQKVLVTDNNPEAIGFYKSMGFEMADNKGIVAFVKFE